MIENSARKNGGRRTFRRVNLLKTEMEYGMIKWIVWERKDTKMSF
jgi:hypothetical protein